MRERSGETPGETFVSITLNRASLGEASHAFATINAAPGNPNHIAYVPRGDIRVNRQLLTGEEISARLRVRIVEKNEQGFLVETQDEGKTVRWRVDGEGKILPARLEPVFDF